jgi:hypothetical protein
MATNEFWRIETEEGRGAYMVACFTANTPQHPGPNSDLILKNIWPQLGGSNQDYKFGFESFEKCQEWFGSVLSSIQDHNRLLGGHLFLKISLYILPEDADVRHGDKQSIAKIKNFSPVKRFEINYLRENRDPRSFLHES